MEVRAWLDSMYSHGQLLFTFEDAREARSSSTSSTLSSLARAQRDHLVFSPVRGLYVIVPPENRTDGAPPWPWYLDPMLRHLHVHYYVGLLTAAAQHGASPQAAQETQVVVEHAVRDRLAGRQRLVFITSPRARAAPVDQITTPTGHVRIATRELTMLDLVTYPGRAAGWGNVVSILRQLAPGTTHKGLRDMLRVEPATRQVQRLGYLLDRAGAPYTDVLAKWLQGRRLVASPLVPGGSKLGTPDARWRIFADAWVQPD